jgi:hypothetical protein
MDSNRIILKTDLSRTTHSKFKEKYGPRKMKDRLRELIKADVEGLIIIQKTNINNG